MSIYLVVSDKEITYWVSARGRAEAIEIARAADLSSGATEEELSDNFGLKTTVRKCRRDLARAHLCYGGGPDGRDVSIYDAWLADRKKVGLIACSEY